MKVFGGGGRGGSLSGRLACHAVHPHRVSSKSMRTQFCVSDNHWAQVCDAIHVDVLLANKIKQPCVASQLRWVCKSFVVGCSAIVAVKMCRELTKEVGWSHHGGHCRDGPAALTMEFSADGDADDPLRRGRGLASSQFGRVGSCPQ